MKKLILSALMIGSAFAAAPAFAQATGSVDVTGTVTGRCSAATPLSGNITLGELSKTDGTVDPAFASNTGGLSRTFSVKCNGASPRISVDAKPLVNAAVASSPNGYTNTVHYTATVVATAAAGSNTTVADQSIAGGATTGQITGRLAATANNIALTIGSGQTQESNALLEAGTYAGKVEITIAPAA
ncbi:hypothetical protein ACMGDH_05485 [Sphingomonas sp. DT-207]|uniref:hypothetical protein n=1 Tax=Sphingomonas sp. DT-207 TaxID=3396167 RepID=UPI003F1A363D